MKKTLLFFILLLSVTINVCAQKRTKITDDVSLVRYGNVTVIEDNKNQKTWTVTVSREKNRAGEWVYNVACGNKYTRGIAKFAISRSVKALVASTGVGVLAAEASGVIANIVYDDVCEYFKDE